MFSKSLFAAALAAIGVSAFGFDPPAYDATYTTNGITYAQRGGLGMKDFVVTNIDADAVGRVKSVNGKTGVVSLGAEDVGALTNDEERLVENENFSNAVVRVSPPVELPAKWALENVTNANGAAVSAKDVGALQDGTTIWEMSKANLGDKWSDNTFIQGGYLPYVAYGNGYFIGFSGRTNGANPYTDILKSTDGFHWTSTRLQVVFSVIGEISFGGGVFVIPTTTGIYYSTDGVSVTASDLTGKHPLVEYGNGKFVACGEGRNGMFVSSNGINWTQLSQYNNREMLSVGFVNGEFVFSYNSSGEKVLKSADLASFTEVSSSKHLKGHIAFSNGIYVAPNRTGSEGGVLYSTDLTNWTYVNLNHRGSFNSVNFRLGRFYALGGFYSSGSFLYECGGLYSSEDGVNWKETNLSNIEYVYGSFGGMATDGNILVSAYINHLVDQHFIFSRREPVVQTITVNGCKLQADADNNVVLEIPTVPDRIALSSVTNEQGNAFTVGDIHGVPESRKINGQPLTQDITIEGMTDNALVLTNGAVKTKGGAAVGAGAVGALSEAQTKSLVDGYVSSTNQPFCDAVLAVGLNIDTNSVAVLNEIAATFGGFPIAGTSTTVGGLLAALAAAVAMLNKRSMKYDAEKDRYYTER